MSSETQRYYMEYTGEMRRVYFKSMEPTDN